MNVPTRNSLQTYQLVVYNKALHPELFPLRDRRVVRHGAYELEAWIMPGSHLLRYEYGTHCTCELVTDQEDDLPDTGVITAFFCAGERDYDKNFAKEKVSYITTVQTETLSENLYLNTFEEMLAFAADCDGLVHRWDDETGPCLSLLDLQRFNKEVHAQSYHLMAHAGLVLRTQTIFEHA